MTDCRSVIEMDVSVPRSPRSLGMVSSEVRDDYA
jgi:hypothetical protein